jgi:hypothetical protein
MILSKPTMKFVKLFIAILGAALLTIVCDAASSRVRAEAVDPPQAKPIPPTKTSAARPKRGWRIGSMVVDGGDGRIIDMMKGQIPTCLLLLQEGQELETLFREQVVEKRDLSKVPGAQMLPGSSVIINCEIISKSLNLTEKIASGQTICRTTINHDGQVHVDPGYRNVFKIRQLGPTRIATEQFLTMLGQNVSSKTNTQYEKCD